ncbi:hypothetical protein JW926_00910 [Candidatus Sumerlaeota bacterium]|nr:hypothetical protein [Candidatus Sumerlaeota bacterium]
MSISIKATLNGTELVFDRSTGSLLSLSHPDAGTMLDALPQMASLIDVAYPVTSYEPLRLASRFSKGAVIDVKTDEMTIHWNRLGASRSKFDPEGNVAATVTLKADPDGVSIIMQCRVENSSKLPVRQVIFPDFMGLLPFAGVDQTEFRTAAFVRKPFLELPPDEYRLINQFCLDPSAGTVEYKSGGMFSEMWLRWMDLGGFNGGLSLFQKAWGWEPRTPVRLHIDPLEPKLRLLCCHYITIEPGATWESGEFILTPHKSGWAKGIEPYQTWAKQNIHPDYPMPKHVKEGLGFRTLWMSQSYPEDPEDALWKFRDLVPLAMESREHGLNEMVLWAWTRGFELPLPPPFPHLGSEEDLVNAVRKCRQLGVNVAPFISVLQAGHSTGAKYGLTVPTSGGWAQHTDSIPQFQAPYVSLYQCAGVDPANALWQKEVLESCKRLIDIGIPSLSWDQFWTEPEEHIIKLVSQIRIHAKKADPESTFSTEELWNMEIDAGRIDYTWNWGGYRDCQAFTSVFPSPRISCIVNSSPREVKRGFLDNLYLNILPRKPGSVNGSDKIVNHPELSRALKQCSNLRKQFLRYFTDGRFIGNCVLTKPCPDTQVSVYVLPDRLLLLLLNLGDKRTITFDCDLAPWLESSAGKYKIKTYNSSGSLVKQSPIKGSKWQGSVPFMEPLDIAVFEFLSGS